MQSIKVIPEIKISVRLVGLHHNLVFADYAGKNQRYKIKKSRFTGLPDFIFQLFEQQTGSPSMVDHKSKNRNKNKMRSSEYSCRIH